MKRINMFLAAMLLFILGSCNEAPAEKVTENEMAPVKHGASMEHHSTNDSAAKYTPEMVANKRDFICGMPVTAGIADTAHYDGKVYGFCASECKAEFLQNPQAHITAK
ncbi:YHS domain-containing protein [Sediminibacterium salmoneum]|uniref:YHS domain-containing protein n=1 Tax=Sediminibacterium salmoneum TaxID=426421 RepID=UPI00055D4DD2|nr:YHS domain-containing protein [Sediminibacterium salmoneum]